MPPPERDWAPIMALMANLYGFKPWDVERLTESQLQMYLSQSGPMRLMQALPQLQYAFSKLDDEAITKMLTEDGKTPDPNSLRVRGWRVFIRQYQSESEEAERVAVERLPLSQEAAAALVALVETQELTREYAAGSFVWRIRLMPLWNQLKATAALN